MNKLCTEVKVPRGRKIACIMQFNKIIDFTSGALMLMPHHITSCTRPLISCQSTLSSVEHLHDVSLEKNCTMCLLKKHLHDVSLEKNRKGKFQKKFKSSNAATEHRCMLSMHAQFARSSEIQDLFRVSFQFRDFFYITTRVLVWAVIPYVRTRFIQAHSTLAAGRVHEHIFDALSSVAKAANTDGFVAVRGAKMPTSG